MLQSHWQMMGALEAVNGVLLFGISTAFIFTVMQFYYQNLVLRAWTVAYPDNSGNSSSPIPASEWTRGRH